MNDSSPRVSLPEKDYLAILDAVLAMHACTTRQALHAVIHHLVLPLVEAQGAHMFMLDFDFPSYKANQIYFSELVGFSKIEHEEILAGCQYHASLPKAYMELARPVLASDIDFPFEKFREENEVFYADHPQFDKGPNSSYRRISAGMAAFERPDGKVALAFQRLLPHDGPFSWREIRIFELLQPHLFQAVKTVALSELLKKYKVLTQILAATPDAVALAGLDQRVLFANKTFQELLSLTKGRRLPQELAEMLLREAPWEANGDSPLGETPSSARKLYFLKHSTGVLRVEVVQLNDEESPEDACWFLRLKPAGGEPFSKINLVMQTADLSEREMEVALLIRDGIENEEIAQRLFISLHTVKNHVRSLHNKLNVTNRGQLVARLHQG